MAASLKVGDVVLWSHAWGSEPYAPAVVESISFDAKGRCGKYGDEVNEVSWTECKDRAVVVSLKDLSTWAYGNQLLPAAQDLTLAEAQAATANLLRPPQPWV